MKATINVMKYMFGGVCLSIYAPIALVSYMVKTYKNIKVADAKNQFMNLVLSCETPSDFDVFEYCYGNLGYSKKELGGYSYKLGFDVLDYCYGNL